MPYVAAITVLLAITTRCYASTVYYHRMSLCLSHDNIVSKQLNIGSRKQRHTIAQGH